MKSKLCIQYKGFLSFQRSDGEEDDDENEDDDDDETDDEPEQEQPNERLTALRERHRQ